MFLFSFYFYELEHEIIQSHSSGQRIAGIEGAKPAFAGLPNLFKALGHAEPAPSTSIIIITLV